MLCNRDWKEFVENCEGFYGGSMTQNLETYTPL